MLNILWVNLYQMAWKSPLVHVVFLIRHSYNLVDVISVFENIFPLPVMVEWELSQNLQFVMFAVCEWEPRWCAPAQRTGALISVQN